MAVGIAIGWAWLGASASPAAANTYCVQLNPCPQGGPNFNTLQGALDAADAHGGHDTVQIGPVTLRRTSAESLDSVSIIGRGSGRTVLTDEGIPHGETYRVLLMQGHDSTIQDLAINVADPDRVGLFLSHATARRVTINASHKNLSGLSCFDSTFRNGVVSEDAGSTAVHALDGCVVEDSRISGGFGGIGGEDGDVLVRRSQVSGFIAINADFGGFVTVEDTLVRPVPQPNSFGSAGLTASARPSASGRQLSAVIARHVTLFGGNQPGSTGLVVVGGPDPGKQIALVQMQDSIVRNFSRDLYRLGGPPDRTVITVDYSDYDRAKVKDDAPAGAEGYIEQLPHNVNNIVPRFVSPGTDFHLLPESPLIDIGRPGALHSGESITDLGGDPRLVDGDGDGIARRDMGAYESQQTGPPSHVIKGSGKGDTRQGSKSADVFRLGEGDDTAFGGRGADWLFGGTGLDQLVGGPGPDRLFGGADSDQLDGGKGGDRLFGGHGPDKLVGGAGVDTFRAGGGDDFIRALDGVPEVVDCGPGKDSGDADANDSLLDCEKFKQPSGAF